MNAIKDIVKRAIRSTGYDLHRYLPGADAYLQLLAAMNKFGVEQVLDIGANVGQFASALRSAGFRGEIVSFEPLSSAHRALLNTAKSDPQWTVHPRCAIGDRDGEVQINISGNSLSSSLLPMTRLHSEAEAESAYVGAESVPIFRLDAVAAEYSGRLDRSLIKIDTQGAEWQVLDGAAKVLPQVRGILCEISLVPLYEGQKLWRDVIQRIERDGFKLWSIQPGFVDNRDGRTLQLDASFFRA